MKVYSIDIFKNIKEKNTTNLPFSILQTINELSELVSAPEYNKTPEFLDKYKKKKRPEINNQDLISFSRTIISKKEGIQKEIDLIRGWLNKMTDTSYTMMSTNIKNQIKTITNSYSNSECEKLGYAFIDMLLYNILYSNLYAKLLKELYIYDSISMALEDNIKNFLIIYKDNQDFIDKDNLTFDELSIMNKKLDKNKGKALLFVNLLINEVIEKDVIINFINELLNLFFNLLNVKEKNDRVNEITEIIYILVKNSRNYIKDTSYWEEIENNIIYISNMKSNSRENITNKIIFKFMDLKDEIK